MEGLSAGSVSLLQSRLFPPARVLSLQQHRAPCAGRGAGRVARNIDLLGVWRAGARRCGAVYAVGTSVTRHPLCPVLT